MSFLSRRLSITIGECSRNTFTRFASSSTNTTATKNNDAKTQEASACPASTTLTGLNIYKGKADPVALPDEEYPSWLYELVANQRGEKELFGGMRLLSTEGLTKGELRSVEKRNLRIQRQAMLARQRAEERERIRLEAQERQRALDAAKLQSTIVNENEQIKNSSGLDGSGVSISSASSSQGVVSEAPQKAEQAFADTVSSFNLKDERKKLRKANRELIKSKNFIKSQSR